MNCQLTVNSLIVGYGNSLRGDDRIGLEIARIVADWNLPQVKSLYLPQLVPELAAELAKVDLVLFVDAYAANVGDEIKILQLEPATSANFDSHLSNPQTLLNLTQTLFQKCPSSWWILVPGNNFELGDWLTPAARQGIEQASKIVRDLLNAVEIEARSRKGDSVCGMQSQKQFGLPHAVKKESKLILF
ncbi:MAG: hydrogenase maturation protease [Cyanobacteria bacterium P01_G01_bin.19]